MVTSTLVSVKTVTGHNLMCHLMDMCKGHDTLPKTNSWALKVHGWNLKMTFRLGRHQFGCYAGFREANQNRHPLHPKSTKPMMGFRQTKIYDNMADKNPQQQMKETVLVDSFQPI